MRQYNEFSKSVQNKRQIITDYGYKEGVFETPQGKFIARVKKGKNKTLTTLSQHNTIEEAELAYNEFYNSL